ncbi:MAG: hypothetical protein H7X97_06370 [Opitutaceae bacterium]|nr:hypothetical protein [Verrucomicrobiales bacterium]
MNRTQKPTLKVARILIVSLLGGLVLFTATVIGLRTAGSSPPPSQLAPGQSNVLLLALVGLCVVETPLFFLVPRMILRSYAAKWAAARSDDERETVVLTALQVVAIIRGAFVEGIGLFGCVIYMISGEPLALIAPGVAIAVMIGLIPTREKQEALTRRLSSPT